MTRMNPEIKKQWVAALRSGKYTQGKGCLRDELSHYCCLGVLTRLAVDAMSAGQGLTALPVHLSVLTDPASPAWRRGVPPEEVVRWAGLGSGSGDDPYAVRLPPCATNKGESLYSTLYILNDTGGYSFDRIADLIEEQF